MTRPSIGRDLLDVPMGDMIRDMALAIAEAQMSLDSNSIEVAQMMGGLKTITQVIGGEERVTFEDSRVFFGKEKMLISTAIDVYNNTTDATLRASIKQTAIDNNVNVEESNVIVVSADPDTNGTTFTPNIQADYNYLYRNGVTYYAYDPNATLGARYNVVTNPTNIRYRLKAGAPDSNIFVASRVSMLELGFSPTFYQFVDTIIEVKITIRFTEETNSSTNSSASTRSGSVGFRFGFGRAGLNRQVSTSQVNASYSQKFNYSAEGSSLLRTKLTPIPPPAILEERIRQQMEIARENK
jgi:hypothetical protein